MRSVAVAAVAALFMASGAEAAVSITSSAYDLAAPAGAGVLVDFDDASLGGFTLSGSNYVIQSGNNGIGAAPAAGPTDATDDATKYLSVYGGSAKLAGTTAFHDVSLFWGSIDNYNAIDLLDLSGNVLSTITAGIIPSGNNGDQLAGSTNRRINVTSDDAFYGLQFRSTSPALEIDNVKFSHADMPQQIGGAVPEPASWAMMVMGFGALGAMTRSSKRRAAYADA